MQPIVECVPNFSEGRDRAVIDAIAAEISSTEGVKLLDVDPGVDTNRTVVTFIGAPDPVAEAAFRAIRKAAELIDMRRHRGAHARMGATDVCPFVPVAGVSMADCVALAERVGERVARELAIPVYLYEAAARRPERRNLAEIRKGEYEGLAAKLADPEWAPDFGRPELNARSGATVIGARPFLIAYNVNLNTRDRKLAHEIALNVREGGRAKRDEAGEIVRNPDGTSVKLPGSLPAVKAVGWYMEAYGCAQVSINLVDMTVTPPHVAFDECCRQAEKLGLRVTGSELVGLIPRQAMLEAGRHYLRRQGRSAGVPEAELVHIAIQSLGLSDVAPFDPQQRIIENHLGGDGRLVMMTQRQFADELSSDSPAPGGGSVAALAGALGAALAAMVGNLTMLRKDLADVHAEAGEVAERAQKLKDEFLADIDRDTEAFNAVLAAVRLPKKTDEEKAAREQALEAANKGATEVPLGVLRRSLEAIELAQAMAERGNPNSASDAGVGAGAGRLAAEGAYLNVLTNLQSIQDQEYVAATRRAAGELRARAVELAEVVGAALHARLGGAQGHGMPCPSMIPLSAAES